MSPLNSRVWRRYGQLRIYVSADTDPVGWFDPRTGRSQLSQPGLRDEFWAAVRAECQRLLADGHITEPALPPEATPAAPPPPTPVGARRVSVRRGGPADVAVLPSPRALRQWLRKQRPVLEPSQVDAVYAAARRPASWQSR